MPLALCLKMSRMFLFTFLFFGAVLAAQGSESKDGLGAGCEVKSKVVEYGALRFEIPELMRTGFILRPRPTDLEAGTRDRPEIRSIHEPWNFNHLMSRHQPISIGRVSKDDRFGDSYLPSVLDMPIKFPGTDHFVPDNFRALEPSIQRIIDFEAAINPNLQKSYYAYLTVHQSWVEPNATQRRPGLHVDGFQGPERPVKELIEHSYLLFNATPTVFTQQGFDFANFDFTRYNAFSEMDRQSRPELEFPGHENELYFFNAYTIHRADPATRRVLRTFVRITYSVAIFDRLGLSDNPLFPYSWDRKEKNLQASLLKYTPPLGLDRLGSISSLAEIRGRRIGLIGVGEGSDALQAAQVASLLERQGREIAFVASFRKERPHLGGVDLGSGLIQVDGDFQMPGRNFESRLAGDFATFVLMDDGRRELSEPLSRLVRDHGVDSLVFVDSGGNVLSPHHLHGRLLNDHRTLLAAESIPISHKSVVVVCPGIEMPSNAHELLANSGARRYRPDEAERQLLLSNFGRWGMSIESPHTFAFTPMIWQQALRGDFGDQRFPTQYPGDPKFPVTPESQDLMVSDFETTFQSIFGRAPRISSRDSSFLPEVERVDLSQGHTMDDASAYARKHLGDHILNGPVIFAVGQVDEARDALAKAGWVLGAPDSSQKEGFHRLYSVRRESDGAAGTAVLRVNTVERLVHLQAAAKILGVNSDQVTTLGSFFSWKKHFSEILARAGRVDHVIMGMPNSILDIFLRGTNAELYEKIGEGFEARRRIIDINDHELANLWIAKLQRSNGEVLYFVPNLFGAMAEDLSTALLKLKPRSFSYVGTAGSLDPSLKVFDTFQPSEMQWEDGAALGINWLETLGNEPRRGRHGQVPSFLIETEAWLKSRKLHAQSVDVEFASVALAVARERDSGTHFHAQLVVSDLLVGPQRRDISFWSYQDGLKAKDAFKPFIAALRDHYGIQNDFVSLEFFSLAGKAP